MTERQRRSLAENARIYHAQTDTADPSGRSNANETSGRAGAVCLAAVLFMAVCSGVNEDTEFLAGAVRQTAALIGYAAAKTELLSPTDILISMRNNFPENNIPAHDSRKPGNNIGIGYSENTDRLISSGDDILMLSYGSRRMPSSANEELYVEDSAVLPGQEGNGSPLPYPDDLTGHDGVIRAVTYTAGTGENYIDLPLAGQLRNVTSLSRSEILDNAVLEPDFNIVMNAPADEPQVLIMHTHTTESYEPYTRDHYDEDFLSRTTDSSKNMVAVGEAMTDVFESRGIRTIHDTTVHDYPSYNGSYDRSRETVTAILEKYPSIKVVLDVHRDAIERADGERVAPTAEINGKSSAQVMLICGCDDGTMGMPECMKNLRTAALFQQYMESRSPGLTRPILYDYRQYNQDLTTGSLLIEVGGHANSIDQAIYAGQLSAEGIADALETIAK